MTPNRTYVDRIVNDLRVDLTERIHHVENTARDAARSLSELLRGFPQTYATKADLEHVRTTADELQIHLIGRERFERFESAISDQIKAIENQQSRGTAIRTTILATLFVVVTLVIVLLSTMKQTVDDVDTRTNRLEHQVIVLQQQIKAIQALDHFFCATRIQAKLPAC